MSIDSFTVRWLQNGRVISKKFSCNEDMQYEGVCAGIKSTKSPHGQVVKLRISGNKISLVDVRISISIDLNGKKVMANGYQTWTGSRELDEIIRVKKLNPVLYNLLKPYGDYSFNPCSFQKGHVFSWTYSMQRSAACNRP